jgi:actin-related protein
MTQEKGTCTHMQGVKRINVGGKLLTNYLKELVSYRYAYAYAYAYTTGMLCKRRKRRMRIPQVCACVCICKRSRYAL